MYVCMYVCIAMNYIKQRGVWGFMMSSENWITKSRRSIRFLQIFLSCHHCSNMLQMLVRSLESRVRIPLEAWMSCPRVFNPLTPELSPSAQRCLPRFFLPGILILKGLTARRLCKSFDVKGLSHRLFPHTGNCKASLRSCQISKAVDMIWKMVWTQADDWIGTYNIEVKK
jgi:hypothetical protein